jgi:hypothetical protein
LYAILAGWYHQGGVVFASFAVYYSTTDFIEFNPARGKGTLNKMHFLYINIIIAIFFSGTNGIDDLLQHNFFATINWEELKQKKQDPPFKPTIVSDEAFYFDSTFTSKTPKGNQEADVEEAVVGAKNIIHTSYT